MYSLLLAALMFPTRMVHSGVGLDQFPDSYLDSVAAAGMSAVIVYVSDPPETSRNGRVDINDLVRRARARGLDVYAYAHFFRKAAKLHPLDPGARELYDATYGAIVKNAPGLKGLICVGESIAFPSRDPGMGGYWWQHEKGAAHMNGFWPSSDWTDWLKLVSEVTRKYRPDFEIVFWTYNWFHAPEADRLALLERIPTNVTLHVTYEMDAGDVDDYSIVRPGPSAIFRSEAAVARRRGIRLTSMTNTGGRTWDFGGVPFVPAPRHWLARFRALRASHAEFGLAGLMDSHHYGFTPSIISELAATAFSTETSDADLDRALDRIAARDFGADNVAAVKAAWDEWDAAMDLHPTRDADQWGELRLGPAYPLVKIGETLPLPPDRTYWKYVHPVFQYPHDRLAPSIDRARREIARWQAGCDRLEALLPSVPADRRDAAQKMLGVGRYCERTMRTLLNHRLYCLEMLNPKPDADKVRAILRDETENVKATIPLVTADPRLGWEPSMRFVASPEILNWKLRLLNETEKSLTSRN